VGGLAELAAKLKDLAERTETEFAAGCIREMAPAALAALKAATPKRSGKLAGSETIDSITGSGTTATAILAPHTDYAEFREYGGTIHAKDEPARSGRVHQPSGIPYRHSLAWAGGFAMHVTQAGSHYMERGEAAGRGPCASAAAAFAAEFFTL
jgi:hypothetical protein